MTENDEGQGLVKIYWKDIHSQVAKIEPIFAKIVDELSPDKTFPLYLAFYPYGAIKGDTQSTLFPKQNNGYFRLSDPDVSKDLIKNLGYSIGGSPIAMLLDKNLELFIDLKKEKITIPWLIYSPGAFFPFSKILSKKSDRKYTPNGVLSMTSGARSAFMLPNIGCVTNHVNLQRDFNIQLPPPKSLYEHWYIFKEIVNSKVVNHSWRSCIMYFSEKWLSSLENDSAWMKLKLYLHELAWHDFEYRRNSIFYHIALSVIQKKRNLKPNPYLADTARHLIATALGAVAGYTPADNDDALPLDILQTVFVESYGLKKYFPTIMQPVHFNFEDDKLPVYYSLQHPSTHVFSPKSRADSSTLFEMRELEHITRVFIDELAKDNELCSDTIINKIAKGVQFNYYHNKTDRHGIVKPSRDIPASDKRFEIINTKIKMEDAKFSSDAPFVRGCISIHNRFDMI